MKRANQHLPVGLFWNKDIFHCSIMSCRRLSIVIDSAPNRNYHVHCADPEHNSVEVYRYCT